MARPENVPEAPTVLVLGSYPCAEPRHGGQVRLAEIARAYRRGGARVRTLSVFDEPPYQGQRYGRHDLVYPVGVAARLWHGAAIPLIEDLTSGQYAATDEQACRQLGAALFARTDLLHLEQPWLLPLVLRWRRDGRLPGTRLVYGSQNIEAPLKAAILRHYGVRQADEIAAEIAALEAAACAQADVCLAVSASDQAELQRHATVPVTLAPNGIAPWQASPAVLETWRKRLPAAPFALFVGSAHPPNISGFYEMFGKALACIPPATEVVVAGSVGPELLKHPAFLANEPLNRSRLRILGVIDDADLAAVKTLAHLFVLPITEGGGSNIKTAEALYAGAYVVGTPVSFRGFHAFAGAPGVCECADPAAFRAAVATCLRAPRLTLAPAEIARRQTLVWEQTLAPVTALVGHPATGDDKA